jgi:hypothetical protein
VIDLAAGKMAISRRAGKITRGKPPAAVEQVPEKKDVSRIIEFKGLLLFH